MGGVESAEREAKETVKVFSFLASPFVKVGSRGGIDH